MNYSEVLHDYQPLETGDFMLRYEINDCEYIVYSPKKFSVSCVDLKYFRELTAYQLAAVLGVKPNNLNERVPEFSLKNECTRGQLLTYLFDVEASGSDCAKKKRHVSGHEGYFLYNLKNPEKIVNFFQFDGNGESSLVFYDTVGVAEIGEESDTVHVTWSPYQLSLLEKEENCHALLLASANPLVLTHVFPKVKEKKIMLHAKRNPLQTLCFLAHYSSCTENAKSFKVRELGEEIVLSLEGWSPISVVRYVSSMNKAVNSFWKKELESESEIGLLAFRLQSIEGVSFVLLPNLPEAIEAFIDTYIKEASMNNLVCC